MPKQTKGNKKGNSKVNPKGNSKGNKAKKHEEEKKPKQPIKKITKQNAVGGYKTKTSKATTILASGGKFNGRKLLSQKQIQMGKETHQYKASTKRIKQLQRNGVPRKAIQEMLRKEAKAAKTQKRRQNKKFGVKE